MNNLRVVCVVCLFAGATPVFAQPAPTAATPARERGWLDVNIGIASAAEDSLAVSGSRPLSLETATFATAYSFPRGADFDLGGGVMFSPVLGVGVSITGTAHEDNAGLAIRIPHPLRFNAFATDADATNDVLTRAEGGIHPQLMVKLPIANDRLRVRFFGGPSYFRLTADAVSRVNYEQTFQILGSGNVVDITTYDTTEVEATGWGFHVGGDLAYMFGRVFGVGGFLRVSRGSVTIEDDAALADGPVDVTVGGFQTGGGIRLRF